jgi:hypothetical protein
MEFSPLYSNEEGGFGIDTSPAPAPAPAPAPSAATDALAGVLDRPQFRDPRYVANILTPSNFPKVNIYFIAVHGGLSDRQFFTSDHSSSAYIQFGGGEFAGCIISAVSDYKLESRFNSAQNAYNSMRILLSLSESFDEILYDCNFSVSGNHIVETSKVVHGIGPGLSEFQDGYEKIPERHLSLSQSDIDAAKTNYGSVFGVHTRQWGVYKLNHSSFLHTFERDDTYDAMLLSTCYFSELTNAIQMNEAIANPGEPDIPIIFILASCAAQSVYNTYAGTANKAAKVRALETRYGELIRLLSRNNFFYVGDAAYMPALVPVSAAAAAAVKRPAFRNRPLHVKSRGLAHNFKREERKTRRIQKREKRKHTRRITYLRTLSRKKKFPVGHGGMGLMSYKD